MNADYTIRHRLAEQIPELTESINRLAESARKAVESVGMLDYSLRLLSCRSNRQKRKIRHELLVNARGIERGFDHLGTRQDSAFEQARDRAVRLRDLAKFAVLPSSTGPLNVFVEFAKMEVEND